MNPFIGEIRLLPYMFTNLDGWLLCNGQTVNIPQFQALHAAIGQTYGGDGRTNFKLPDLRNCVPIGAGVGPGLTPRALGQPPFGGETIQLTASNFAPHTHGVQGRVKPAAAGRANTPAGNTMLSAPFTARNAISPSAPPPASYTPQTISLTGKPQPSPRNNEQPFLMLNFYIAYDGDFPVPE